MPASDDLARIGFVIVGFGRRAAPFTSIGQPRPKQEFMPRTEEFIKIFSDFKKPRGLEFECRNILVRVGSDHASIDIKSMIAENLSRKIHYIKAVAVRLLADG